MLKKYIILCGLTKIHLLNIYGLMMELICYL